MNSKRLLAIAAFIEKDDYVIDIGCDHAYIDIYLAQNKLCKKVIASDISLGALQQAEKNIKKFNLENKIKTIVSNGFRDINDKKINIAIIAGMGTHTIIDIIKNNKLDNLKKIIIQSNNNHYMLRKSLNKLNYFINKEIVVKENNKYYIIMECLKGKQKLKYADKLYGKNMTNATEYYSSLLTKYNLIIKKLPKYRIKRKLKLYINKYFLLQKIKSQ